MPRFRLPFMQPGQCLLVSAGTPQERKVEVGPDKIVTLTDKEVSTIRHYDPELVVELPAKG